MMLHNGDCLEVMRGMDDSSVDLVVTSPPYDNLRQYCESFTQWGAHVWEPCLDSIYRVLKDGCVCVWITNDAVVKGSETCSSFLQAIYAKDTGFRLHDTMIWRKPNPIPRNHKRYDPAFEYMFIFSKGAPSVWNPIKVPCKNAGRKRSGTMRQQSNDKLQPKHKGGKCASHRVEHNVWEVAPRGINEHPAVFPILLAKMHIESWSDPDAIVLDPFMGSGTTGIACANLGRRFIGIELAPEYFKIASTRIEHAKAEAVRAAS